MSKKNDAGAPRPKDWGVNAHVGDRYAFFQTVLFTGGSALLSWKFSNEGRELEGRKFTCRLGEEILK